MTKGADNAKPAEGELTREEMFEAGWGDHPDCAAKGCYIPEGYAECRRCGAAECRRCGAEDIPGRKYSEPIPDSIHSALDAVHLVLDDNDHTYTLYSAGKAVGAVWHDAVVRDWFYCLVDAEGLWAASRDDALVALIQAYKAANR